MALLHFQTTEAGNVVNWFEFKDKIVSKFGKLAFARNKPHVQQCVAPIPCPGSGKPHRAGSIRLGGVSDHVATM